MRRRSTAPLFAQCRHRAKSLAGAAVAACAVYAKAAVSANAALTLHGLEAAAVSGVAAGLLVHGVPNAPKPRTPRKRSLKR